jgi:hypothetical protein
VVASLLGAGAGCSDPGGGGARLASQGDAGGGSAGDATADAEAGTPASDAGAQPGDAVSDAGGDAIEAGAPAQAKDFSCRPAQSSQPLPARSSVTAGNADAGTVAIYLTDTLFYTNFSSACGGCHVSDSRGNWHVTRATFAQMVTQPILAQRIKSDDPSMMMPPPPPLGTGIPFSQRDPGTDPIYQLASLLQDWIKIGSDDNQFPLTSQPDTGDATMDFAVTPQLGAQLTNIGSCVPGRDLYATDENTMNRMDLLFARATDVSDLPATLSQTDLVTLDSAALARDGVISYAPAYPLWSDDAGKMRYVRVPRGQHVTFDAATQTFQIPRNTRFYKTFLKKVTDLSGNQTYRKIETRLIVSRPDQQTANGPAAETAIFGTYVWNDDETEAVLWNERLNDGTGFKDELLVYTTDEPAEQDVIADAPPGVDINDWGNIKHPGLFRHYAIPSSQRCTECHMGSPSASFVLGFTPLQISRRPADGHAVVEAAAGDELTQLQRLIDYGVIAGVSSPDDILQLEKTQGLRTARTPEELTAQAYMIGNCAHCHNPRGFPSIKAPALADVLDFLPGPGDHQGIFQFDLDTMSPLRHRGALQEIDIPYITPVLRDYPDNQDYIVTYDDQGQPVWVDAPWRSLIYRNVDTPFDYIYDSAIFPHMPLNSPGYDCRAAQIMGDWMVSIPSVLKNPDLNIDVVPIEDPSSAPPSFSVPSGGDADPQPSKEVLPGDPGYAAAQADAADRLQQYHSGRRYSYCLDTSDIVDPNLMNQLKLGLPLNPGTTSVPEPNDPTQLLMTLPSPPHAHWVVTDTTHPSEDWVPKNPDWAASLIAGSATAAPPPASDDILPAVLQALTDVRLDDVRDQLLQEVPFGLWDTQHAPSTCTFSDQPTVASFTGASRPAWMDVLARSHPLDPNAPVYSQLPGAAIFTSICFNCHGLHADAQGLLSDEVTLMTGGEAQVADFRDGLFGPVGNPGSNRAVVFGAAAATLGITGDDLGARYMAWMALGGTTKHLPIAILQQLSVTPVLGQYRGPKVEVQGTPDMLLLGIELCLESLAATPNVPMISLAAFKQTGQIDWGNQTGLIDKNGDAEMWLRLCSLDNRPIVRVVSNGSLSGLRLYWGADPAGNPIYPATAPVMDHHGRITNGIGPDNPFPICNLGGPGPSIMGGGQGPIPPCPSAILAASNQLQADTSIFPPSFTDARKWAARGAINGALAVFLYLDRAERTGTYQVPYNQCDQ